MEISVFCNKNIEYKMFKSIFMLQNLELAMKYFSHPTIKSIKISKSISKWKILTNIRTKPSSANNNGIFMIIYIIFSA